MHTNKYSTYPTTLSLLLLWELLGHFLDLHLVDPMVRLDTRLCFLGKHTDMSSDNALYTCLLPGLSHGCLLLCLVLFPTSLGLITELAWDLQTHWPAKYLQSPMRQGCLRRTPAGIACGWGQWADSLPLDARHFRQRHLGHGHVLGSCYTPSRAPWVHQVVSCSSFWIISCGW